MLHAESVHSLRNRIVPKLVQQNRLAKFFLSITAVVLAIAATGVTMAYRGSTQLDPAAQSVLVQTVVITVAVAVAGLALVGLGLARPTIKEIDRLGEKAAELEAGNLDVDLAAQTDDEIGQLYESFDSMRTALKNRIEEVNAERERAEAAKHETEVFADRLETRAAEFGRSLNKTADGDLTVRLSTESADPDALKKIADSFNEAMAALESTLSEVEIFTEEVAETTDAVTASADEVAMAGEETSEAIDEISAGADRQTNQLVDVGGEMETMSATTQEVAATAEQVAETSEQATTVAEDGRVATRDAVDRLHSIEDRSESTAGAVRRLEAGMDEIGAIVDVITDIADQTNLLALNASIEAARADGDGNGFVVVAEEVKSLAEKTSSSASDVESLIAELRERTDESVEEITTIRNEIREGVETIEGAESALGDINERIREANDGVQEISEATSAQARSVNEVSGAIDDLADIGQKTAGESTRVAAAAEEQAATLRSMSEDMNGLAEQTGRLEAVVDRFVLETEPGAKEPKPAITEPAAIESGENGDFEFVMRDQFDGSLSQSGGASGKSVSGNGRSEHV